MAEKGSHYGIQKGTGILVANFRLQLFIGQSTLKLFKIAAHFFTPIILRNSTSVGGHLRRPKVFEFLAEQKRAKSSYSRRISNVVDDDARGIAQLFPFSRVGGGGGMSEFYFEKYSTTVPP